MGIRFLCPNGHKLHVKAFLAGKRGVCPDCQARFYVPTQSMPSLRVAPVRKRDRADQHSAAADSDDDDSVVAAPGLTGDPLAGTPDALWYVRHASGEQFGPAAPAVMRRWLAEGRVPPDSLVWRNDWDRWRGASAVFASNSPEPIGSEFEFDPLLISPQEQSAAPGLEVSPVGAPTSDDDAARRSRGERRRAQQKYAKITAVLVVAVLVLLPLVWYVLFAG